MLNFFVIELDQSVILYTYYHPPGSSLDVTEQLNSSPSDILDYAALS